MIRLGNSTKKIGDYYEDIALEHIKDEGCQLVARNFRSRWGEIDLIAKDKHTLAFIEVRFRRNTHYGSPLDTVTVSKQQKLARCADYFLQKHNKYMNHECRFDAIAISGADTQLSIQWIKQAFTV